MTNLHEPDKGPQTPGKFAISQVSRLSYGEDALQFGELHLPDRPGPHPVALVIHGGFWRAAYGYTLMTGLSEDLAQRGIAAWNIEYRRLGDPQGGWPNTLLDVAAAADYLGSIASRYDLDLRRVVTVGHSAGGHLALWLAARPRLPGDSILAGGQAHQQEPLKIMGAVSQAGVVDLERGWSMNLGNGAVAELLGGSFNAVPERYAVASPAALLPLGVPQVLIHGTADDRVPFEISSVYAAKAQAAGDVIQLITLHGEDHFVLINVFSTAWAKTVQAIQELLI
ncbi:MAG: alpha/beta hydrolase family protein [Ktedonobacteraceae bacterium]|jgi:acetyl esterase/lipase